MFRSSPGRHAAAADSSGMLAYSAQDARGFGSVPRGDGRSQARRRLQPSIRHHRPHPRPAPMDVVQLSSLSWLNGGPAGNGSHVFIPESGGLVPYIVAEPLGAQEVNEFNARNCTASRRGEQIEGRCLPLPSCALRIFARDVANYLPFFCALGNHAGSCCPEEVVLAQLAQTAESRV